jgi:hypothetical protein
VSTLGGVQSAAGAVPSPELRVCYSRKDGEKCSNQATADGGNRQGGGAEAQKLDVLTFSDEEEEAHLAGVGQVEDLLDEGAHLHLLVRVEQLVLEELGVGGAVGDLLVEANGDEVVEGV